MTIIKKPRSKDFWLKISYAIIFTITALILLLTLSRVVLIVLLVEFAGILFTADLRGWINDKIPPALDRIASVISLIIALVLFGSSSEKNSETNSNSVHPSASEVTPTPIITPTATPSQTLSGSSSEQLVKTREQNPQTVTVHEEQTGSTFNDDISIGVNGISFGGTPLHHTVNATIRSPGFKSLKVTDFEVNTNVTYKGRATYEISLIEVNTYSAKFEVRKVEQGSKSMPKEGRTSK